MFRNHFLVVGSILISLAVWGCHSVAQETPILMLPCLSLRSEYTEPRLSLWSEYAEPPIPVSSNIPIDLEHVFWAADVQSNRAGLHWSRLPTTPEVFRLSEENVAADESAAFGGDAQAAFRLANHYGFALHDWSLYLRWCAIAVDLGGIGEAASSMEALQQIGRHPEAVVRAFELSDSDVEQLKKSVQQAHDAKAAFRLALFFGYSRNDAKQRDEWLWTAVTMGSTGAKRCAELWHVSR